MRETLIVLGLIAGLIGFQLAGGMFAFGPWLGWGVLLVLGGLVASVPSALIYHARLADVLRARGLLPRGWYWHPTRLHSLLTDDERDYVLGWFAVGAAGWIAAVVGSSLALFGVLTLR